MKDKYLSAIICSLFLISIGPALGGEVKISNLQYPGSPETLTVGERVPIVVGITYSNLEESTLSLHLAYADFPPRFQSGGEVTLSGSGTYLFPPAEIMVPASYSIPSGWPEYINEWHLKVEIWKGDKLRSSKAFTLLVENPENKPEAKISSIEYVVPPDTIAVGEESLVRVHATYSNLADGTKIEATLRDQSGVIASGVSRPLSGSGEVAFRMTIKPRKAGVWAIDAVLATVSGSMLVGDKKRFQINVVGA
ncbi:MAG: hypothetical protein A4E49_02105 [Methanosaeta sp. PtaU1.Bin112]|nr:MAG: hypothetical protein A4E49_02105 [Methanosaeta sp. PtaU1.Bin112]